MIVVAYRVDCSLLLVESGVVNLLLCVTVSEPIDPVFGEMKEFGRPFAVCKLQSYKPSRDLLCSTL